MAIRKSVSDTMCYNPEGLIDKTIIGSIESDIIVEKTKERLINQYVTYVRDPDFAYFYSPSIRRYIICTPEVLAYLNACIAIANEDAIIPVISRGGKMLNLTHREARILVSEIVKHYQNLQTRLAECMDKADKAGSVNELYSLRIEV